MADELFLCARCARHQTTCCQHTDVHVTLGDIQRIETHAGQRDFHELRPASNPEYLDQEDDPIWAKHVNRPDGTRRVLRQQVNGDCTFLSPHGCVLPLEVRPLICRLYPLDYTADGIRAELASGCPLELLRPGQQLLEVLQMDVDQARGWHRQLYVELGPSEPLAAAVACATSATVDHAPPRSRQEQTGV